jgi:glycosyltransferase involved in cell wall biosynthesis
LTVIKTPNRGQASAVNTGLAAAKGDVVVVINSDDPMRAGALRAAADVLHLNPNAVFACGDWDEIDPSGSTLRTVQMSENLSFEHLLRSYNINVTPAMFIRRWALAQTAGRRTDRRYTSDIDLAMRLAALGPIVRIPRICGTHRVHDTAAMSTSMGWRMALEVSRVAYDCLDLPHGLNLTARDRRKVKSYAHFVSTHFCGANRAARFYHTIFANALDPPIVATIASYRRALQQRARVAVVRTFRWAYSDPNLSARRTIKSWLYAPLPILRRIQTKTSDWLPRRRC